VGDRAWGWVWLTRLAVLDVWFWGATLFAHTYIEPVSRRSCNAAYCLWMVAFNLQVGPG